MTNVTNEVWKILDESPCIRRTMRLGLIKTRALAKYLITERMTIDASLDAVISAIRRYDFGHWDRVFKKARETIPMTNTISTKGRLANLALSKDAEIQGSLPEVFSIIHYNQGDVLRITQADESINILMDEKNLEKIKMLFPENKIIGLDRNLAEININLPPDARDIPGVIAVIAIELAINNINVMHIMGCGMEIVWFVEEKDITKTYRVLQQLLSRLETRKGGKTSYAKNSGNTFKKDK